MRSVPALYAILQSSSLTDRRQNHRLHAPSAPAHRRQCQRKTTAPSFSECANLYLATREIESLLTTPSTTANLPELPGLNASGNSSTHASTRHSNRRTFFSASLASIRSAYTNGRISPKIRDSTHSWRKLGEWPPPSPSAEGSGTSQFSGRTFGGVPCA